MKTDQATTEIKQDNNDFTLFCSGTWTIATIPTIIKQLKIFYKNLHQNNTVCWDFEGITEFDSAGFLIILNYFDKCKDLGCKSTLRGLSKKHQMMHDLLRKNMVETRIASKESNFFAHIGEKSIYFWKDFSAFLAFLGESTMALFYYFLHPSSIRFRAMVKHIDDALIGALGIIALTAFLIGVVIAYQSAVQLEKFGANIFIVDMIGISVTRELAPLITAIVVAGRSGSSYTAQIGVMKLTEEVDAMKTMGFDPFRFLVLPRTLALMIALPLLIFFADIVGILGGMIISKIQLNISYSEFINHLRSALDVKHYWVGLIKGPFFAWLIASVGCFRGFQVSPDTESIGYYTTVSVVNAIFLVIACDALFSIILTELKI
ncbi:MlaE family lipid ABC transporter permease subunit [bacterium]|nr:MlaE family lipid ABC transporter permease subunit [bacterium]MBU1956850.1 MlaE family lipid ABC transporter permease subunit [bacterium]